MPDDVAQTNLIFDATGAKRGADEFKAAADKVIAANNGIEAATKRVVTGSSAQTAALDRIAKSFDPFIAAAARAQRQVETLNDIIAKGSLDNASPRMMQEAARATDLMTAAIQRLNVAQANQAFGGDRAAAVQRLTAAFAPAQASAQRMGAELASLNQALELGINIEGGYAATWDKIVLKYDEGAQAAIRAAAAQRDLVEQTRAAQNALNAQQNINALTGVQTSPGSVGGVAVSPVKSAADSASVFQDQFAAEEKLAAENNRLMATYPSLAGATLAHKKVLDDMTLAVANGTHTEQEAQAIRDKSATGLANYGKNLKDTGTHADGLSHANAGVTRELIVMGHEVLVGNYTRLGGSMLVLTERVQFLQDGLKTIVLGGMNPFALASVAVIGTLTALGVAAENNALRVERLRNELSLVRDDFGTVSAQAEAAAKHIAATSYLSTADARAGAGAVAATPGFNGTQGQIETIVRAFADLSTAQQKATLDTKQMSDALRDPAAFLAQMEGQLKSVDSNLVIHAKLLQDSGDKAGAFALALAAVQNATKGVAANRTPLEQALHNLDLAFTQTGQSGRSFADSLGTPIVNGVALAINALGDLIGKLQTLGREYPTVMAAIAGAIRQLPGGLIPGLALSATIPGGPAGGALPSGMVPTTSYGGSSSFAPGTPRTGSIPNDVSTQLYAIAERLNMRPELADFATRIAQVESGGHQFNKGGGVLTSGAGALGVMQVMPSSAPRGLNLADQQQNIEAGLRILMDLDRQFGGDFSKIAVGYNAGPGRVGGTLPLETQNYLAKLGLGAPGATSTSGASNPEGGPTTIPAGGTGLTNLSKDYQKIANDLSNSTPEARVKALQASLDDLDKALEKDPTNQKWLQEKQALSLELYNTVPAAQAAVRAIELDIAGQNRMATAWGEGATAAARQEAQNKALTEALKIAKPGTEEYAAAVAVLTNEFLKDAAAQERVKLAQASNDTQQQIGLLQLEAATLGMDATARQLLITHRQNEIAVMQQFPNVSAAERAARVADMDQVAAMTLALQRQQQGLDALAGAFSQSFDTIGNAMAQAFIQGNGAAVNWKNVMTSVIQQVMQQILKLGVLNPVMNSLFGQNNPTLSTVGSAINQQATNGTGLGGMLANTALGRLFGLSAGSASFDPSTLGAVFSTSAGVDVAATAGGAGTAFLQSTGFFTPLAHSGWLVGMEPPPSNRYIHPAYFDNAPRFHAGLGADEFTAILQRGERVLTKSQQGQVMAAASGGKGQAAPNFTFNFPANTQPDSFKAAGNHVARAVMGAMSRVSRDE